MKRLYGLIAILLIFLGFAFVQERTQTAKKEVPAVGFSNSVSPGARRHSQRGSFTGSPKKATVGKNVKIDFQNAQNDQAI